MVHHNWGDKNVDWKGISDAANFISNYSHRYGRLGGTSKEKYGTVRFYASFGYLSLHTLLYPGYHYSQFPKWLWTLDIMYIGPFMRKLFERPFVWWQKKVYNRAYQGALKRWPHLRGEILADADWVELIEGATRKEGKLTHVIGWNGEILTTWSEI